METTIQPSLRRLIRPILVLAAGFLLFSLAVPLVNVNRFSEPLRLRLETTLGRSVAFENVHFSVFSGFGFVLENVTIGEDPRFGLEPFAFVETFEAHLRPDKLLLGQLRFTTLRLLSPSLNIVKQADGSWNVVQLIDRLAVPRSLPLTFLPTFEIADARVDFKLGTRKTTLYLSGADVSLYPERSGKLYIQFAGSPARSDRAGMGFGHFRGRLNWYSQSHQPDANRLEAEITLEPSNLSELTTLIQGYDLGIHGTVGAHFRIDGPERELRVTGDLQLDDVHRWDLLPLRGEAWRIGYAGTVDLTDRTLHLETVSTHAGEISPVAVQIHAKDFLGQAAWSVLARLHDAPAENLVPVGRRMGLAIPPGLQLTGAIDGVVGYTPLNGLSGGVVVRNVTAQLPNLPLLKAKSATATISRKSIHIDPTPIQTTFSGTLRTGADYYPETERVIALIDADQVPVAALKGALDGWFGSPLPDSASVEASGDSATSKNAESPGVAGFLDSLDDGLTTGHIEYRHQADKDASWTGALQLTNATAHVQGLGASLEHLTGSLDFDDQGLDLNRLSFSVADHVLRGDYHHSADPHARDRLHLHVVTGDLGELESLLDPSLRARGILARLHVGKRIVPPWLSARNLDAKMIIDKFSVGGTSLGRLDADAHWRGTNIVLESVRLTMPSSLPADQTISLLRGKGSVSLASYAPVYRFSGSASNLYWRGGVIQAKGEFVSSGSGADTMQNFAASGTFDGKGLGLSDTDTFATVSGDFVFAFTGGVPQLRLSSIQATDVNEAWNGQANTDSEGKLIFDLQHEGRQRRVVSTLDPEFPTASVPTVGAIANGTAVPH